MSINEDGICCEECKPDMEKARQELLETAMKEATTSPAFRAALARRQQPIQKPPLKKRKNHHIEAEHTGKAGDRVHVAMETDRIFRGEKLTGTESVEGAVLVHSIYRRSDARSQRPPNMRPLNMKDFAPNSLSCGSNFDTILAGDAIVFELEFVKDAEWSMTMFGSTVI